MDFEVKCQFHGRCNKIYSICNKNGGIADGSVASFVPSFSIHFSNSKTKFLQMKSLLFFSFVFVFTVPCISQQPTPKGAPDLKIIAVHNFTINENLRFVNFDMDVKNQGQVAVDMNGINFKTILTKTAGLGGSGNQNGGGANLGNLNGAGIIAPGETKTLTNCWFSFSNFNLVDYQFVFVFIDATDKVKELSETNNQFLEQHGFPKLADLRPVKNEQTQQLDFQNDGQLIHFEVENVGRVDAPASKCTVTYKISPSSGNQNEVHTISVPAIPVGGSVKLIVPTVSTNGCGGPDCIFEVKVDPRNQIKELKEDNNILTGAILG